MRNVERHARVGTMGESTDSPTASASSGVVNSVRTYYEDQSVVIYHGDAVDVLQTLEKVDHLISDPPYAADVYLRASAVYSKPGSGTPKRMGLSEQTRRGGALQKMANGEIGVMDSSVMAVIAAFAGALVRRWSVVFSDAESCHLWKEALVHAGMRYVRTGAWVKPDYMPQMSGDRPAVGFEPCTIVHAQGPMRWNGGGLAALWTYGTSKGIGRPDHPCPKPEPLMCELVTQFTDVGDLILDPFGGSGTTAVAAKKLGRRCILIEREEKYCAVAAERVAKTDMDERYVRLPDRRGKQGALFTASEAV